MKTEMLCIFHPFTKQSATEPYTSDICTNSLWLSHKSSVGGAVQSQGNEHMEQMLGTVGNRIRAIIHSVNLGIPHFTLCKESIFTNP